MDESENYPAINRALAILRERYKHQIEKSDYSHVHKEERSLEDEFNETDSLDSILENDPHILKISPQPQEMRHKSNLFHGLAQRAKDLQTKKQKIEISLSHSPGLLLKVQALEKALKLCDRWSKMSSSFHLWKLYSKFRRERKGKFSSRLNQHQQQVHQVSDNFSKKFSFQYRRYCNEKFGKSRLSQSYDNWRICRTSFYRWIESLA
jgi:hypothetical protein